MLMKNSDIIWLCEWWVLFLVMVMVGKCIYNSLDVWLSF